MIAMPLPNCEPVALGIHVHHLGVRLSFDADNLTSLAIPDRVTGAIGTGARSVGSGKVLSRDQDLTIMGLTLCDRTDCMTAGVHIAKVAGIKPGSSAEGAYSICLNGYPDDIDKGDTM